MKRLISLILTCVLLVTVFGGCGKTGGAEKTILIYMCGSDLETKQGLAGKNIDEILKANIGSDINVVIETGGAQTWRSHDIDNSAIQRYAVKDGKLILIDTLPQADMGKAETLTDFLTWGQKTYKSGKTMLVLWDHGGGSAKGVCFDENYSFDSLSLTELRDALDAATLGKKFDFITFDACLMATIEVVSVMKDYADYMIASEEIIPGGGMDYKAICEAFASDGEREEIGKKICDAFMDKCKKTGKDIYSTLSLVDLSNADALLKQFDVCCAFLNKMADTENFFSHLTSAAKRCEKFGMDNPFDDSSNMVDMVNFFDLAWDEGLSMVDLVSAVDKAVPYIVNSGSRSNAGVSFYYPITYAAAEVEDYVSLSVSEEYTGFLKKHFCNVPDTPIRFTDMGSISGSGAFSVSLAKESYAYLSTMDFVLMRTDDDGIRHILCTNNDIDKDYDNMVFKSNFRGVTLAFKGRRMYCSALSNTNDFLTFETPVRINCSREPFDGVDRATLQYGFVWDESMFNNGYYVMSGIRKGPDENGIPDNTIYELYADVKIRLLEEKIVKDGKELDVFGDAFECGEISFDKDITEMPLDGTEYQYVFRATDIFGNVYYSDMATMKMKYTYDELLENPLPDRTPAAEITNIEPYIDD